MSFLERVPKPELTDVKPSVIKTQNNVSYRPKDTEQLNYEMINNKFYNTITKGQSILIQDVI